MWRQVFVHISDKLLSPFVMLSDVRKGSVWDHCAFDVLLMTYEM
jgi:hypothetical protein